MKKYIKYKKDFIVSDFGEIWKINKNGLKIKKLSKDKDGYLITNIKGKTEKVHRIVIKAFRGESELTVDHINGNKKDNRLSNLQYMSIKDNAIKSHGLKISWNGFEFLSLKELDRYLGLSLGYSADYKRNNRKLKGYYIREVKND